MRLGGHVFTNLMSVSWIAGLVLLSDGVTVVGLALTVLAMAYIALLAFNVRGAALEAARVATRLRSRGDRKVITAEQTQAAAKLCVVVMAGAVALFASGIL